MTVTLPFRGSAVAFASAFAAVVAGCGQSTPTQRNPAAAEPQPLTSSEVWYAFQHRWRSKQDEEKAERIGGGAVLIVTGQLVALEGDLVAHPVLILKSPDKALPLRAEVSADSRAQAVELETGEEVILRCSGVEEVASSPMLRGCRL